MERRDIINFHDKTVLPKERGLRAKMKLIETDMFDREQVQQFLDELENQKEDEDVSTK